jgi:two-component system sensor histidine kinase YesM
MIINFLDRHIRQVKIHNRLVISFAILSLVPLLITGIFAYYKSSEAIKTKISTYSIQVMNQVSENIQNELAKLENDSVDIAFSDLLQNTLISYDTLNEWEKNDAELKMQGVLAKRFSFFRSVTDVLVYTKNKEKIIAFGDLNFRLKLKPDYLIPIFEEAMSKNGVPVWTISDKDNEEDPGDFNYRLDNYGNAGILLSRSFRSLRQGTPIGYMIVRLDEKYILQKFKDIDLGNGSEIFILDGKGKVISSRSPEIKTAKIYPDRSLIEELKQNKEDEIFSFNSSILGKRNLPIPTSPVPTGTW